MAESEVASANRVIKFRRKTEREMPLQPGSSPKVVSGNIRELHSGNTYARTKKKFGAKKANKQAVAIALSESRKSGRVKKLRKSGMISPKAAKKHFGA